MYSQDIGMEFDIEKWGMLIMKKRERQTMERIKLANHESIRTFGEKENYKYLEILEADTTKPR